MATEKIYKVPVNLDGCHDSTSFELAVDNNELRFLRMLVRESRKHSELGCQPVLTVGKAKAIK